MTKDLAEAIAISALGWLCHEEDLLPVFLAATGASAADLRAGLAATDGPDQALLVAALDFILMRDDTVIAAARAQAIPEDRLAQAHMVLSGPSGMHWT